MGLVVLAGVAVHAQSATEGALVGVVRDAAGAPLAGATVHLASAEAHTAFSLATDARGRYAAAALDPGEWTVHGELAGVSSATVELQITAGETATLDLQLGMAVTRPAAGVQQPAAVPELFRSSLASPGVSSSTLAALPLHDSSPSEAAEFEPTATADGSAGNVSFAGLSALLNSTLVDGLSTTASFAAQDGSRSRAGFTLGQSGVRQLEVHVADYSAQYGRAAGAVVNVVTASGGSSFHGAAAVLGRDNTWLSLTPGVQLVLPRPDGTLVAEPLPTDWRLQGGLSLGGGLPQGVPLHGRLFWHLAYDEQHRNFPALATITNSPQLALSQALPSDPTGFNPAGYACSNQTDPEPTTGAPLTTGLLASPGSETVAALYGTQGACFLASYGSVLYPNYATAAAAYNNALAYVYSLLGTAPRSSTVWSLLPRLDWKPAEKHAVALAWNSLHSASPGGGDTQPFVDKSVTSLGSDHLLGNDVSLRLSSTLSQRLSNELRTGYAYDSESEYGQAPLAQEPHTGLNGTAAPGVRISQTLTLGTPAQLPRANFPAETRWQLADSVAIVHGAHVVHVGADVIHTHDRVAALQAAAGYYRYDTMQQFLIDVASQASTHAENCAGLCYSTYEQGFGQPGTEFGGNQVALYGQDDVRVTPYLTLQAGLRWEYQKLPTPQYPNPQLTLTQQFAADHRDFAPRLGFAWTIPGASRTVLRGGYGLFYATTTGATLYGALVNTGTYSSASRGQSRYDFATQTASSNAESPKYPTTLLAPPTGAGAPDTVPVGPTVTALAANFRRPLVQQASLTVEESFGKATVVSVSGVLSLGRHLPVAVDTDLYPPGSNNLPGSVTYQFLGGGPLNGRSLTVPFYVTRPENCATSQTENNPCYGAIDTVESRANATYSALAVRLRHAVTQHWELRLNYSYSHALDDGDLESRASRNQVLDPYNFGQEHGRSSLDRPQQLTGYAVWHTEWHRGPEWLGKAASGWQVAPIVRIASGEPYSATVVGTAPAQENSINTQTLKPASYGYLGAGGADYLAVLGRNHYRGPATQTTDLRVGHALPTGGRRLRVQASAEAFNLFNHNNIASGNGQSALDTLAYRIGSGQSGLGAAATPAVATWQPGFGQPVTANATNLFGSRELQFSLRAEF